MAKRFKVFTPLGAVDITCLHSKPRVDAIRDHAMAAMGMAAGDVIEMNYEGRVLDDADDLSDIPDGAEIHLLAFGSNV